MEPRGGGAHSAAFAPRRAGRAQAVRRIRLDQRRQELQHKLIANTRFGGREGFGRGEKLDHEVLHRDEFRAVPFLRNKLDTAAAQIGTSGSGNHFVEFGVVEVTAENATLGVAPGRYVGLLSHSGSRGLGAACGVRGFPAGPFRVRRDDALAAADWARAQGWGAPVLLGWSHGGSTALAAWTDAAPGQVRGAIAFYPGCVGAPAPRGEGGRARAGGGGRRAGAGRGHADADAAGRGR